MKRLQLAWRREMSLACLVGMDALCLAAWTNLLLGSASNPARRVPAMAVFLLLLGTLTVARGLEASHLPLGAQRVLAGVLAIITGVVLGGLFLYREYPFAELDWLLAWAADLPRSNGAASIVLLGVALYAWWRGISLAQSRLESDGVGFSFRAGIVSWLWYLILSLAAHADEPVAWLLLYFALGLVAVGLARVEDAQRGRAAIRSPFAGSWAAILAGAAALTVALGAVATWAVSWSAEEAFWSLAVPLAGLLDRLLLGALSLAGILLAPLLEWLIGWLQGMLAPLAQSLRTPPTPAPVPTPEAVTAPAPPAPALQAALWLLAVLALLAVVAFIVSFLQRRPTFEEPEGPLAVAWEGAPPEHGGRSAGTLRQLGRRLAAAVAALGPRPYSLATVREIYAGLQRLAARHGVAREEAQTPYEYERHLDGAWPAIGAEVEAITDAYVRAHYGQRQISDEELAALRAAWQRLREALEGDGSA
jgi:hypothetical protein